MTTEDTTPEATNDDSQEIEVNQEDTEQADNPPDDDTPEDNGDDQADDQAGDDGQEGEETQSETVLITGDDGQEYEVPAELAPGFMKNADYTQKTQANAEERKALEAEKERFEAEKVRSEEDYRLQAQVMHIDDQLKQYDGVDWAQEQENDPDLATKHYIAFQELERKKKGIVDQQTERATTRTQEAQQELHKRSEQTEEWAAKNLPGWSPQMAKDLYNLATQDLGYTQEEFGKNLSPKFLQLLSKANVGQIAIKKSTQAKVVKKVSPTKTISTNSAGSNRKDVKDMSMSEYAAYREKQERAKNASGLR